MTDYTGALTEDTLDNFLRSKLFDKYPASTPPPYIVADLGHEPQVKHCFCRDYPNPHHRIHRADFLYLSITVRGEPIGVCLEHMAYLWTTMGGNKFVSITDKGRHTLDEMAKERHGEPGRNGFGVYLGKPMAIYRGWAKKQMSNEPD